MKITRQNYEPFFIDFLEGRLSVKMRKELMGFLELNPDLRVEIDEYEEIILPADESLYFNKEGLKKGGSANEINEDNFEQFCIAAAENDLEDQKKDDLIEYIGNDKFKKQIYELYNKIRLEPDNNVLFENRELLYVAKTVNIKKSRLFPLISAAASVIIILSLFFLSESPEPSGIAETPVHHDSRLPEPVIRTHTAHEIPTTEPVGNIPGDDFAVQIVTIGPETLSTDAAPEKTRFNETEDSPLFSEISERYQMTKVESLPPGALASAPNREIQFHAPALHMYDGFVNTGERANQPFSIQTLAGQLTAGLIDPAKIPVVGEEGVSIWQIADAGIKSFSRITGKEVHFEKETDQEGRIVAFVFESGNFGISRVRGKN